MSAVTMEGIAARARVGKPTIYRAWPNAQAVAMAALMEIDQEAPERRKGDRRTRRGENGGASGATASGAAAAGAVDLGRAALAALRKQLRGIAETFTARTGRSVALMLASANPESELTKVFRNHFILARREEGRRLLKDAVRAGAIRRSIDLDVALDLIYAPIFYRLLVGHAPLDAAFTDAMLDDALRGLAPRRA